MQYHELVRAVVDTNVVVTAFRSDSGASRQVLEAALSKRFELLLSVSLMLEYEAVLCRPENLAASGASVSDVENVLDALAAVGNRIAFAFRWRPALPDPNDDMVLETAVNGRAEAIVTSNQRDFRAFEAHFNFSIMTPGEFLRTIDWQVN